MLTLCVHSILSHPPSILLGTDTFKLTHGLFVGLEQLENPNPVIPETMRALKPGSGLCVAQN
jgi:hypothetical protein